MNAKKRALGKGLSALLDNSGIEAQPVYDVEKDLISVGTIGKVPIDIIELNPFQPRADFDEEALNDLAASIKEQGVIQPITLRKSTDDKLQLIAGERRLKASKMAGLSDIPAYIISADEGAMLEIAIVENIQRENLNPIEVALGYKQLLDNKSITQEVLSEKIGKSRSSIANTLRLLKLPGEIQIGLRREQITTGHAKALLALDDIQTQIELFQDILAQELSVREVEDIIKNIAEKDKSQAEQNERISSRKKSNDAFRTLQHELENSINTNVQIKSRANGKGSIIIKFNSEEELNRLADILRKHK
jgi:ParB family transcriptional regulator, chromosome partitioning protein